MRESPIMTLPSGNAALCFNKEDFTKVDFNVEHFIVECRRQVNLDVLRNDLHIYSKILQSAMIELINKDYADFVNLSTNLVGMDKAINHLISPLIQLKTEITKVRNAINDVLTEIESKMNQRKLIREKKDRLKSLILLNDSIDLVEKLLGIKQKPVNSDHSEQSHGILMERVALEFNKLQFNLEKNLDTPLVSLNQQRIDAIESKLRIELDSTFAQSITEANRNFKESNLVAAELSEGCRTILQHLSDCLRTYGIINRREEAEKIFRLSVVREYVHNVIVLHKTTDEMDLKPMYKQILKFFPEKFTPFKMVTFPPSESQMESTYVLGYDFIVNSIWPEVVFQIETELPGIFAPGNPDQFHERYVTSMEFVNEFENECPTQNVVKKLRSHSSYNSFHTKWMLPVYFQIRFQDIAGQLEGALLTPFKKNEAGGSFQLKSTCVLWETLNLCWADNIYLNCLVHRFWKLTLQLISRFSTWINEVAQACRSRLKRSESSSSIGRTAETSASLAGTNGKASAIPLTVSTLALSEMDTAEEITVADRVSIIADANKIASMLEKFFENVVEIKLNKFEGVNLVLLRAGLNDAENQLLQNLPELYSSVASEIASLCCSHLRSITDIPRLYRRTNRDVPSRSSTYVAACIKPLRQFLDEHNHHITTDDVTFWSDDVIKQIAEQFLSTATEVLESVRKMEESLRRLKAARGSAANQSASSISNPPSNQILSDDDKIRMQIKIDVEEFLKLAANIGVNVDNIQPCKKLLMLIENHLPAM